MKLNEGKFKKIHGYEEGKADALDPVSADKALSYKKDVLKNFTGISQHDILSRFTGSEYFVSRKYDGEYAIIFYDYGQTVTVNRSGRTRRGIPCIKEAGKLIEKAGFRQGIFPAEIYVEAEYKTRVNDLIHVLAHQEKIGTLRLAVFDILELDGQPFRPRSYGDKWNEINRIFGSGKLCRPADMLKAQSGQDVLRIYKRWVDQEDSEGLIVHTPVGLSFKVKPRHNLDVVVIGYTEGSGIEVGQARSLLMAFVVGPNQYQVLTHAGSGLNENLRRKLFRFFSSRIVRNAFEGTGNKYEKMEMVRPDMVIEISVGESITEIATGERTNYLLNYTGTGYEIASVIKGYRFLAPVFIRVRDDKAPDEIDVSPGQIEKTLNPQRVRNERIVYDVLINGKESVIIQLWKDKNGQYIYYVNPSNRSRQFIRSADIFELIIKYEQAVCDLQNAGYCRDQSRLSLSDRFVEILHEAEEY